MIRRAATICVVGAVLLAACGGSSSDSSSSSPSATFATIPETADSNPVDAPVDIGSVATTTNDGTAPIPEIDLPTKPPDEIATSTQPPLPTGPLPIPKVSLVPIGEFANPVDITTRPDDPRTFVVEQGGRLIAVDDLGTDTVLDITSLTKVDGERGLLGAAFHPTQDLAYVYYARSDGSTVVDEYAVDPVTAVFDAESRRELMVIEQPFANHNGGELTFGPDELLYLGLGDGGSGGDPQGNGLDLSTPLGKILRFDPIATADDPYDVPADNPFADVDGADPRIWSLGLRNPWKFSFDSVTGDLWIADVGQGDLEEINHVPAVDGLDAGRGISFGWSAFEGTARFNEEQSAEDHTFPLLEYDHSDGNCSVSGGAVSRGDFVPDLAGWYVYGDFCSGRIWAHDTTSAVGAPVTIELAQLANLASIAVGGDGDLYAVSNVGTVSRFSPA